MLKKHSLSFCIKNTIIHSRNAAKILFSAIFLPTKKKGFFVDIGAFHPYRFSNTYLFYRKGWNGLNIDAAPGSMKMFNQYRKRDINVEVAISEESGELTYYDLGEKNSMNTFSLENLKMLGMENKIEKSIQIKTEPLYKIFDEYIPNTSIDFMSIDVEGLEIPVLKSNNWQKYSPKIIILESFDLMNESKS